MKRGRWISTVLNREPLGSQIVRELRLDIFFGRLAPGEQLFQEALCLRFSTSRMPVRDALRQLVYEGLVESLPGNRLRVAELNRVDLFDMFWMEATVHAVATKRATARVGSHQDDMAELEGLQVRMMGCSSHGDMVEASRINRIFHRKINLMAESPKLIATLRNVSMGIQGSFIAEVPDWLQRSIEEHGAILDAMREGRADDASELMFLHVQASGIKIANDVGRGEGEPLSEETVRNLYPRWMSDLLEKADGGADRG